VVATPVYLRQLGMVSYDPALDALFNGASKGLLYVSGIAGTAVILYFVFRAYSERQRIRQSLTVGKTDTVAA
jgi:hypothetical protein